MSAHDRVMEYLAQRARQEVNRGNTDAGKQFNVLLSVVEDMSDGDLTEDLR